MADDRPSTPGEDLLAALRWFAGMDAQATRVEAHQRLRRGLAVVVASITANDHDLDEQDRQCVFEAAEEDLWRQASRLRVWSPGGAYGFALGKCRGALTWVLREKLNMRLHSKDRSSSSGASDGHSAECLDMPASSDGPGRLDARSELEALVRVAKRLILAADKGKRPRIIACFRHRLGSMLGPSFDLGPEPAYPTTNARDKARSVGAQYALLTLERVRHTLDPAEAELAERLLSDQHSSDVPLEDDDAVEDST